jgi:hypothetical protein
MRALVFAVALGCATVSGQQAAARQQVSAAEQAELQALQTWLAQVAAWTAGYQNLQHPQGDLMDRVLSDMDTAVRYAETGDRAGGRAWAVQWRAAREAEIAAIDARLATLDPTPPALPPLPLETRATIEPMTGMFARLPPVYASLHRDYARDVRGMMDVIAGVAEGDAAALRAAPGVVITRVIAMSRSSVLMMETSISLMPDADSPQAHMMRTGIAGETAVQAYFQLLKTQVQGQPGNPAATSRAMEDQAALIRTHAAAMETAARRQRATLSGMPPGEFRSSLFSALDTYVENATVDRRLADVLEAAAGVVAQGERAPEDAMDVHLTQIEQLSLRRFELDALRRAYISG